MDFIGAPPARLTGQPVAVYPTGVLIIVHLRSNESNRLPVNRQLVQY